MKNLFFVLMISLLISCNKDKNLPEPKQLDKPSAMNIFCQQSPNNPIRRVEYQYDNTNIIAETLFYNDEIQDKATYTYNSDNLLILEVHDVNTLVVEKTHIYNALKQLVNIKFKTITYGTNGQINDVNEKEAPRKYKNNLLVKEWEYWGGFNTYEYSDGKRITRIEHNISGEQHHITSYKYSGNLLIEEKKVTKAGSLIYLKTYTYDAQGRVIKIKDGENTVEENDYKDNQLIEKRTYYFGIDPGYNACNGNFIHRYEY